MIRTGADLKAARQALGWSLVELAEALRLRGVEHVRPDEERASNRATRVRKMETGNYPISGPVSVAVEAFLAGFRPEGFSDWLRAFRAAD